MVLLSYWPSGVLFVVRESSLLFVGMQQQQLPPSKGVDRGATGICIHAFTSGVATSCKLKKFDLKENGLVAGQMKALNPLPPPSGCCPYAHGPVTLRGGREGVLVIPYKEGVAKGPSPPLSTYPV